MTTYATGVATAQISSLPTVVTFKIRRMLVRCSR